MNNKEDKICHYSGLPSVSTYKSDYVYDIIIDISIICVHCGSEFEIEVENMDGVVYQEECCSTCLKKNLITYNMQEGNIVRLKVS